MCKKMQENIFSVVVNKADGSSEQWYVKMLVGSIPVEFKTETDADVNVICEQTYHSLIPICSVNPCTGVKPREENGRNCVQQRACASLG